MKPIHEFPPKKAHQDQPPLWPTNRHSPLTNQCYQGHSIERAGSSTGGETTAKRSFREISCRYLRSEAVETFITEAALFGLITIIAAFGLILCADALAQLMQSVNVA